MNQEIFIGTLDLYVLHFIQQLPIHVFSYEVWEGRNTLNDNIVGFLVHMVAIILYDTLKEDLDTLVMIILHLIHQ